MKRTVQLDLLGERDPLGLTPRQRRALDFVHEHEPIQPEQLGAHLHEHAGCAYCEANGRDVLSALRALQLVTQRRAPTRWELTKTARAEYPDPPGVGPGELPEGF